MEINDKKAVLTVILGTWNLEFGIQSYHFHLIWVDRIPIGSRKSKIDVFVVVVSIVSLYLHI